jgi:hypothetical protein
VDAGATEAVEGSRTARVGTGNSFARPCVSEYCYGVFLAAAAARGLIPSFRCIESPAMNISLVRCSPRLGFALSGALLALAFGPMSAIAADPAPPADTKVEVPIVSDDEMVNRDLAELDRLLDANPKLEEKLSANLEQLTQEKFRMENPEIDALLKRQPNLERALRVERYHFVHRSIARLARSRVTRADAIALDEFLTAHRDIARALQPRPSQIVEPDFLIAHPPLADFFTAHPSLSSVLLQRDGKKQAPRSEKKK